MTYVYAHGRRKQNAATLFNEHEKGLKYELANPPF